MNHRLSIMHLYLFRHIAKCAAISSIVFCIPLSSVAEEKPLEAHPAAPLVGKWVSTVNMNYTASSENLYWWTGRVWGAIDETGRITMRADNGCDISGAVKTVDSLGIYGEVKFTNCESKIMNEVYSFKATKAKTGAGFTFSRQEFNTSKSWVVSGAFVRY